MDKYGKFLRCPNINGEYGNPSYIVFAMKNELQRNKTYHQICAPSKYSE